VAALAGPAIVPASEARVAAQVARELRSLGASADYLSADLALRLRDTRVQGVRNRIVLKYLGVDFEYWNTPDMVYRGGEVAALEAT
jgi:uncharacterized protein with HEPN domain